MKATEAFDLPRKQHHIARVKHYCKELHIALEAGDFELAERCAKKISEHTHNAKNRDLRIKKAL